MSHSFKTGPDSPGIYSRSTSPLSCSGCDVVKKGPLYVKRLPTKKTVKLSLKTWQKKYLMLRDDWKDSGTTTLDIYDRESEAPGNDGKSFGFFLFGATPYTVDLRTVMNVELYLESRSFVHAIILIRSNNFPVILGAESELEMKCWMATIKHLADKASQLVPRVQKHPSWCAEQTHSVKRSVKGSLSLMSNLNHSSPQLCKVVSSGQQIISINRQLSSSTILDVDLPEGVALRTPRTSVASESNSLQRISNSLLSNLGIHRDSSGSKWRPFSKSNRKDSGFSESFDDSTEPNQTNYCPPHDVVEEEDQTNSSPPPLPPRQFSNPFSPLLKTPIQEPWFNGTHNACPPRPPPRPVHTLSLSSSGIR